MLLRLCRCSPMGAPNKPGTTLERLLHAMGIYPSMDCPCIEYMEQMDEWEVKGCRENRTTIIGWLEEGYRKWGWGAVIWYAARGLMSGIAFKLSPFHPIESLVDLAIQYAETPLAGETV